MEDSDVVQDGGQGVEILSGAMSLGRASRLPSSQNTANKKRRGRPKKAKNGHGGSGSESLQLHQETDSQGDTDKDTDPVLEV